jgi:general secretion pathway protein J
MPATADRDVTDLCARGTGRNGSSNLGDAGFTLLELLISLTLLAALSAVLFSGLRFGTRAWERSEGLAAESDEIGIAQNFLRRQLSDAYPLLTMADPTGAKIYFEGGSDSLQFLAPAPAALAAGGNGRFVLVARQHDGRNELRMMSRFELAREDTASASRDATLLRGFEAVEFAYFGRDRPSDPPTWRDTWTERGSLPELIRIQVRFPAGDRREWPELVVAPRVIMDANCLYDPVIRRCRGR